MAQPPKATTLDHFAELDDPRVARTRHHKLADILAIAICGADVFARLDPVQLQYCFVSWTQAIAELSPGEVVAIDGKTARRSHVRAGKKWAIHIRSLTNRVPGPPGRARPWAKACPVPRHGVKTDEITAIPQLLELLDLHGCIVTIDAMGCQREIAQQITESGADYVLWVKENQGNCMRALGFDGAPHSHTETVDKGHGRVERRECWGITDQDCLTIWTPKGNGPN